MRMNINWDFKKNVENYFESFNFMNMNKLNTVQTLTQLSSKIIRTSYWKAIQESGSVCFNRFIQSASNFDITISTELIVGVEKIGSTYKVKMKYKYF